MALQCFRIGPAAATCVVLGMLGCCDSQVVVAGPVRAAVSQAVQSRCLSILQAGLEGKDFWPSIHAAEGLTLGGQQQAVIALSLIHI